MLEQWTSIIAKVERTKVKASDTFNQEENYHSFVYNFHTYCSTTEIRKMKSDFTLSKGEAWQGKNSDETFFSSISLINVVLEFECMTFPPSPDFHIC